MASLTSLAVGRLGCLGSPLCGPPNRPARTHSCGGCRVARKSKKGQASPSAQPLFNLFCVLFANTLLAAASHVVKPRLKSGESLPFDERTGKVVLQRVTYIGVRGIFPELTLCNPMDHSPPGSSIHWDSPGKNTGVGCHAFLQGIFPNQRSKPSLPHYRQILYCLSHQGSPY